MEESESFLSNPKLLQHYSLLQELGVLERIKELKREALDYEGLLKDAVAIFHNTSIDDVLETTVRCISDKFLPSFLVFLWRMIPGKETLVIKGYRNFRVSKIELDLQSLAPFDEFFSKYPAPINYELLEYQLGDKEATQALSELGPQIVVPVTGLSGLYGLILIGPKLLEDQYQARELTFLDRLMSFTSIAIQNHLHYAHSVRDVKTGLFNHGFFMTRLSAELSRVRRSGGTFAILVMDVDKFKNFNDSFGHLAGDRVLETIAEQLGEKLRVEDVLARFGGEEFTVLLPDTHRNAAFIVAERLREAVANASVEWELPLPRVTISLGLVCFNQLMPVDEAELLARADSALYQSKERGRNRTTVWGSGLLFRSEQARLGAL
ncbi:hypothetical protein MASR2M78_18630 [Treponema sp.]